MTDFIPDDPSIWWDNSKAAELVKEYKLLFATSSTYEAYLFSLLCKTDGLSMLVGSATTTQEAVDLIEEVGTQKLICLLSDSIACDCGGRIAAAIKKANDQSHCILIVNDPEKVHSLPRINCLFSALCSSGNVGRGGLYRCLESLLVESSTFVDPTLKQAFSELDHRGAATLNPREREILVLVAQGLTNKEIAQQIFIAERTVRDYVSLILGKLAVPNRAGAAAWAIRHGIAGG
jgi:DNA-binding NarL/FixJ family response regulator